MGADALLPALKAAVGDELCLTVEDPGVPVLKVTFRHRVQRSLDSLNRPSRTAAQNVLRYMTETGVNTLSTEEALKLLLGARQYRWQATPDSVWLLPVLGEGLYHDELGWITTRYARWHPSFGQPRYGYWDSKLELTRFQAELMRRNWTRKRTEAATACVNWWCWVYHGDQTSQSNPVALGALLRFLWIIAPGEADRRGIPADLLPEVMAIWFECLCQGNEKLAKSYADHIAACGLTEAYQHRLRTGKGSARTDPIGWEAEGYRWIGPAHYFASDPTY